MESDCFRNRAGLFFILSLIIACGNNSNESKEVTINYFYDTTIIQLGIDSSVTEVSIIEDNRNFIIPKIYDDDWGEFYNEDLGDYKGSKEDSLQRVKNKQIWQDSVEAFKKRMKGFLDTRL